ncbi:ciliary microtubule-associated protein 3-like [Xenentodon cancila]
MPAVGAPRVVFGSTQERRLLPGHLPPDRLGIQQLRQEAPHLGPGCYDNHKFGTIVYDLEKRPGSTRGYSLSARTAPRFPHCNKTATPLPHQYQPDQSRSRVPPPGKTPFNSTSQRFKGVPCTAESSPGPGTYRHDAGTNRKVSWPMRFGRPDWTRLPQREKQSLRVKHIKKILYAVKVRYLW